MPSNPVTSPARAGFRKTVLATLLGTLVFSGIPFSSAQEVVVPSDLPGHDNMTFALESNGIPINDKLEISQYQYVSEEGNTRWIAYFNNPDSKAFVTETHQGDEIQYNWNDSGTISAPEYPNSILTVNATGTNLSSDPPPRRG